MLSAQEISKLQDQRTRDWHDTNTNEPVDTYTNWLSCVERQHRANFDLWHIEDEARTPGATTRRLRR